MPRKKSNHATQSQLSPDMFTDFRAIVLQAATNFVSPNIVASQIFNIDFHTFDDMCKKEFNMPATMLFQWCQAASDIEFRSALRRLALDGNNTAINVYSKYIDKIQKDEASETMRINIYNSLPSSSTVAIPDSSNNNNNNNNDNNDNIIDNDGGVHLG